MNIISFLSQKGGSGKSTLTISLAVASTHDHKKSVIIDTDPQGTAEQWYQDRPVEYESPVLIKTEAGNIGPAIDKARDAGFDYVFIDTAGRDTTGADLIIEASDLCLMPVRPSAADIRAVIATFQRVSDLNKKHGFIINQAPVQTKRARETETTLKNLGIVCPTPVVLRAGIQDAYTGGMSLSEFDATNNGVPEINTVWDWTKLLLEK